MKTFVFLLTAWGSGDGIPVIEHVEAGLTGQQCINAMLDHAAQNPNASDVVASCEMDTGDFSEASYDSFVVCHTESCINPTLLTKCEYEDSTDCFWDSRYMGNGKGQSFYDIGGVKYKIEH